MKILGREPALILDAVKVGLVMLATFGLPFSADQQTWIIAALAAGFGLAKALSTRPVPVTAVTGFVQAVGVLAIGFGTHVTQNQLAAVIAVTSSIVVLLERGQISPKA